MNPLAQMDTAKAAGLLAVGSIILLTLMHKGFASVKL